MTLARRLLMAGGGSGSFAGERQVSLAATGFWNDLAEPKAFAYNGKTYFTYVNDAGDIKISSYAHATRTTTTPYLLGSGFSSASGNVHNSVAVIVRQSDRRILIVECAEGMGHFFANVSTNPEDVTAFPAASTILSGGTYTYTQLAQLSGEAGAIYLWTTMEDGATAKLAYSKSTDGGSTWSAMTKVVAPDSTTRTYRRLGSNFIDRIDIFTTNTDRALATPSSVYHLYMQGGSFYKTDGTLISAAQPFVASSGSLVQDTTYGSARPEGWAYDANGHPACVINSRPTDGSTVEHVRVARWNGSSWTTHGVADSTGQLISSSAMPHNDPNTVYMPRYDAGSTNLELWRYRSADEGVTWTGTQLTSSSAADNDAPDVPIDATALRVMWGLGTYTGPGFNFDVKGWSA